jgi:RNA polymerase sigma-70 factor (ECF subfamily)
LTLRTEPDISRFESTVLVHLDSAYNLARWLVRSEHDAQDVVQEACLRALRSFDTFRGGDARCWLLKIVRNTCCTWLERNRRNEPEPLMDVELEQFASEAADPHLQMIRRVDAEQVREAIDQLPAVFREIVVLRDLEGLSYKEIAVVAAAPIGTVMSRLARARKQLEERLAPRVAQGGLT